MSNNLIPTEHEFEPVEGLPQELPEGEEILWQGRPQWKALARHTFKIRWLMAYFAVFVGGRAVMAFEQHEGMKGMALVFVTVVLSAACLGLVALMAWLNAKATIYTITNKRIVMRIGVAIPMTWNLPFKRIASADLNLRGDDDGDIAFRLTPPDRVGWLYFWPHVQPGRILKARPALRGIAQPAKVAGILKDAVRTWAINESTPVRLAGGEEVEAGNKGGMDVGEALAT